MAEGQLCFSALVWARGNLSAWLPSLARLLTVPGLERVLIVTSDRAAEHLVPDDDRIDVHRGGSFAQVMTAFAAEGETPVLVLTAPVLLPELGIDPALETMAGDIRIAAVAFLSNAAGHLSFPTVNTPTPYSVGGHDATTLTRSLREAEPRILPVPISVTAGGVVLLSRDSVVVTGGPSEEFDDEPEVAVAELVLRVSRRGFRAVLDPTTYVTRLWEGAHWGPEPLGRQQIRQRLHELHPFFPSLHDAQVKRADSPLRTALRSLRAQARGLSILIDASCLGPVENGTQVQTLSLIEALARRDDVRSIGVGVRARVPRYAQRVLSDPKVQVLQLDERLRFPLDGPRADVLHRPFQPTGRLPWVNWGKAATRVVVTLQDLISFTVGAYHFNGRAWMSYRRGIVDGVRKADGVVVISHDVAADTRRERLPVATERLFVVENGTDHLTGGEDEEFPREMLARGWASRPFLVVLGADYSHKNRDLAVRIYKRLREKRPELGLVLAGVAVAEGSNRSLEAIEMVGVEGVLTMPDITSEERNWLLRHAEICLYPTAAEGFGLVPFEAARFGTPTVFTSFGPLNEVLEAPVQADSWDPEALAECCERILGDPELAQAQVKAALASGARYTWDSTAAGLVSAYQTLLAQPIR